MEETYRKEYKRCLSDIEIMLLKPLEEYDDRQAPQNDWDAFMACYTP